MSSSTSTSRHSSVDSRSAEGLFTKLKRMVSPGREEEHPAVGELHRAEKRSRRPSEATTASSKLRKLALLESTIVKTLRQSLCSVCARIRANSSRSADCNRSDAFDDHEPAASFAAPHLRPFTFASLSSLNKLEMARRRQSMKIQHVLPALPPMRSLQEMIEMDENCGISFPERLKGMMRMSTHLSGWLSPGEIDEAGLERERPVVQRKIRSRFIEMV